MTNYREITNEQTGATEYLFNATLTNVGEKTLTNSNGKEYKIVGLKFNLPNGGIEVERTAMCFASNYNYGVEVGTAYLTNLSFDAQGAPQIRMSHLSNADRATASDFAGLAQVKATVESDGLL